MSKSFYITILNKEMVNFWRDNEKKIFELYEQYIKDDRKIIFNVCHSDYFSQFVENIQKYDEGYKQCLYFDSLGFSEGTYGTIVGFIGGFLRMFERNETFKFKHFKLFEGFDLTQREIDGPLNARMDMKNYDFGYCKKFDLNNLEIVDKDDDYLYPYDDEDEEDYGDFRDV